jgi:DNA-binding response OmpR family regulator
MEAKILLVDDDESNNALVKLLLESEYKVTSVLNGKEALSILKTFLPDIILLDWDMPVMDGLTTLKHLKSDVTLKHIPVIMITGRMTGNDDLLNAYNEGAVDFIRKPYDRMELLARIKSILQLGEYYRETIIRNDQEVFKSAMQLMAHQEFIKAILAQINDALNDESKTERLRNLSLQLQSKLINNAWDQVENSFSKVNPGFYKNLLGKHSDLTPAELKLAALLRLNMSSKDISILTNLSVEGIRVSRSRLKKKLLLTEQDNLIAYLCCF